MFENMFGIVNDGSIDLRQAVICFLFALILGVITASAYAVITEKENISHTFFLTLIILPAIVSAVIILVGTNTAAALSIAGVFALVRFRSAPGDGKDITFVFLAMATGLAIGMNYFTFAAFTVVLSFVVIVVVSKMSRKVFANEIRELRILIPENMEYAGMFDDLFKTYTDKHELLKVKTTNMGTLYELFYHVQLKNDSDEKKFIDEIRTRNGNLGISMSKYVKKDSQL